MLGLLTCAFFIRLFIDCHLCLHQGSNVIIPMSSEFPRAMWARVLPNLILMLACRIADKSLDMACYFVLAEEGDRSERSSVLEMKLKGPGYYYSRAVGRYVCWGDSRKTGFDPLVSD